MQKHESKNQLSRELQTQVDLKKNAAKMEADREKEAFELNRKMDQDYWDSERKRLSLAKQKKSEMSDFLSKQIDERKNMKSKHD